MKLRTVNWPENLNWAATVVTPADRQAVATAQQVIELAQQHARQVMDQAKQSVAQWESEAQSDFVQRYGHEFRHAVLAWAQARQMLQENLRQYAHQVARATLLRLGDELTSAQRLQVIIREVLAAYVPQEQAELRVAPERLEQVREQLDQLLTQPCAADLSGVQFSVKADMTLTGDELVLMGPNGSRIRCSFEQIVRQLLIFV